jgi:hypothetical protein
VAKRTIAAGLLLLAACSGAGRAAPAPLAWRALTLPSPPGGGRAEPGAVAAGPPWLVGGAVQRPGQAEPTPAVWSSPDGRSWQARAMQPTTPDGPHTRILSVAVHGVVEVALGNRPSPLHGNARPTIWRAVGNGPFTEIDITRELFGGPDLISLGAVTAGAQGFLVAGSWETPAGVSAAVWFSPDGLAWTRVDSPAQFEPAGGALLEATAAASAPAQVFVVGRAIGGAGGAAGVLHPEAWRAPGPSGPWAAVALAGSGTAGAADAVVATSAVGGGGRTALAVGWAGAGRRVTVWAPAGPSAPWSARTLAGRPAAPPAGKDAAGIALTLSPAGIAVLTVAGPSGAQLWTSPLASLHWTARAVPPGETHADALPVAADASTIVLLDPASGRLWEAGLPVGAR